jgi:hypothetical protein
VSRWKATPPEKNTRKSPHVSQPSRLVESAKRPNFAKSRRELEVIVNGNSAEIVEQLKSPAPCISELKPLTLEGNFCDVAQERGCAAM